MKNQDADFLSPQDHFSLLLKELPKEQKSLFDRMTNTRVETGYTGRTFIMYKMYRHEPQFIDRLVVKDFECFDEGGATTLIQSSETGMEFEVGYTPIQVPNHNVFLFLPLHAKLRWSATPNNLKEGSLAFPICVRTQSRFTKPNGSPDLREKGITYCETGIEYAREFEGAAV